MGKSPDVRLDTVLYFAATRRNPRKMEYGISAVTWKIENSAKQEFSERFLHRATFQKCKGKKCIKTKHKEIKVIRYFSTSMHEFRSVIDPFDITLNIGIR